MYNVIVTMYIPRIEYENLHVFENVSAQFGSQVWIFQLLVVVIDSEHTCSYTGFVCSTSAKDII
jgi:hypothetical protein